MIKHVRYPKNTKGRDFVVGDLHGRMDLLNSELRKVDFDKSKDRLFSVGDLVDRGPESMACLRLIQEPWFHAVMGNHEDMMINAFLHPEDNDMWISLGGNWIYTISLEDAKYFVEYAATHLPLSITVETDKGDIGICHAEAPGQNWSATINPDTTARNVMLWSRERIRTGDISLVEGVVATIHGHTIVKEPLLLGNCNFIDTGAYRTGKLTMFPITKFNHVGRKDNDFRR